MAPSIIIDDNNPAIQYHGGSWLQCSAPNITNIGPAGSPMFETLHMLPTANGTLTYSFNGTGISGFVSNFAFGGNYTTECLVDGVSAWGSGGQLNLAAVGRGNHIEMCVFDGLDVTQTHNLTLEVSFPPEQHQSETGPTGFFFDYFLISPPPSMPLDKRDLMYSMDDPLIQSSLLGNNGQWTGENVADGGYEAGSSVALFNISFTGVAAWWYGFRVEAQHGATLDDISMYSTTYSIDNKTPTSFSTLPFDGFDNGNGLIIGDNVPTHVELIKQLLFHTPEFQYGEHTLKVFSPGSSEVGVHPLTIQNLVIQGASSNNSLPAQTTIRPSPPTDTPFPSDNGPQIDVGKLIGGIVGGIFAVTLVASSLIIACRERARRYKAVDLSIDYLSPEPFPFETDRHTIVVGPHKARETQQDVVNPFMQELQAPPLTKWTRRLGHLRGGQTLSSAGEYQLPQPEIDQHPSSHLQATVLDVGRSALEPPDAHNANGDTAGVPVGVEPIQEEDSGVRLAQQGNRETFVPVLPPVYNAH